MKKYFLIIHIPGPAWKKGEGFQTQDLMAHGAYMHGLFQKGILVEGGPFLDHSGGMAIVHVDDAAQAEEIVRQDPAIQSGVFTADLRPWYRVTWETYG